MAEQLLHGAQVGPALEQVGRGGVAEPVGSEVRRAGNVGDPAVHQAADRALVDPPAAGTEEQRGAGSRHAQRRSSDVQPAGQGSGGRLPVGHRALLAALAEDPYHPAVAVEVVDLETHEFAHPDTGGVEQLEHRHVTQADRAAVVGELGRGLDQGASLVGAEHRRKRLVRLGRAEARPWIGGDPSGPGQPAREHPHGGGTAGERRAGSPAGLLVGQPAAQGAEVDLVEPVDAQPVGVLEHRSEVAEVAAHGVRREVALGHQVALVLPQHPRELLGQRFRPGALGDLVHAPMVGSAAS